jgi:hypothetical protein
MSQEKEICIAVLWKYRRWLSGGMGLCLKGWFATEEQLWAAGIWMILDKAHSFFGAQCSRKMRRPEPIPGGGINVTL